MITSIKVLVWDNKSPSRLSVAVVTTVVLSFDHFVHFYLAAILTLLFRSAFLV